MRNRELRSPSKWRTTSTTCSRTRGPAMEPSLVTWPTRIVVMSRVLATRISAAATSLTWVTPPGHAVDARRPDGLHGVDDDDLGAHLLDVGQDRAEVGLGGEVELVVHAAGAVGPEPHLGGGLLAGDVEGPAVAARRLGGDLEQQGALADPRLAGQQDRGTRDQTAPEDPVELGHAAAAEPRGLDRDLPDRHRCRRHRRRARAGRRRRGLRLGHRAPGLALTAPTHPLRGGPATLGAAVVRAGALGHVRNARRVRRHPRAAATRPAVPVRVW